MDHRLYVETFENSVPLMRYGASVVSFIDEHCSFNKTGATIFPTSILMLILFICLF